MIEPGSRIILRTENAIYSPCTVVSMSARNITVSFCAGMKKIKGSREMIPDYRTEAVSRNTILSMSERL